MKHFSTFSVFTICLLLAHLAAAQTSETAAVPAEQTKAVLPAIFGTSGTQTSFFAAGIYGASSGSSGAIPVLVDSSGQLVAVSSSR
jgi:hypothetical protein